MLWLGTGGNGTRGHVGELRATTARVSAPAHKQAVQSQGFGLGFGVLASHYPDSLPKAGFQQTEGKNPECRIAPPLFQT